MRQWLRIAWMSLWLGSTVFGGVAVAYPLIRERARELGDIGPEEVDALYALSIFLPGPSFLNLWGAVSYRAGGLIGSIIGEAGLLLPAFLLVLLLPQTARIPYIAAHSSGALQGAIWATVGLLLGTGIESVRKLKTGAHKALAAAILAALLLRMHPVLLLVLAIGLGAAGGSLAKGKTRKAA